MHIFDFFPTPVGIFKNNNTTEHTDLLHSEFEKHKIYDDIVISKDKHILKQKTFPVIYEFINNSLHEFSKSALGTSKELKFTQSWLTKHDNIPQHTFPHRHQNSILSGTYYVNADQNSAGLNFHKDNDMFEKYIKWEQEDEYTQNNKYAWQSVNIEVETGVLIIFPSWLKHSVNGNTQKDVRCSLAFNTWFKDPIGSEGLLTLL